MDRLDLDKISNSSIKVLDVYEKVYIEGNSDSKESIYAGYFGGDYCVAFSFIISKKTCTTTYGEVLFTFDEKDRLKEITYTLRENAIHLRRILYSPKTGVIWLSRTSILKRAFQVSSRRKT